MGENVEHSSLVTLSQGKLQACKCATEKDTVTIFGNFILVRP